VEYIIHSILWHRLDQPGHESAALFSQPPGWRLAGTAVFTNDHQPCRLDYSILCDAEWHTIAARVAGWVGEEQVELEISVDKVHNWWMNGMANPAVAGCLDLDLNFSPVTNTLPLHRLGLAIGQAADVKAPGCASRASSWSHSSSATAGLGRQPTAMRAAI
jgi:hypothetical protein